MTRPTIDASALLRTERPIPEPAQTTAKSRRGAKRKARLESARKRWLGSATLDGAAHGRGQRPGTQAAPGPVQRYIPPARRLPA